MWDFSIGRTLVVLARTWPFLLLRLSIYFAITFGYLAAVGVGAAAGYGVGGIWGGDAPIGWGIVGGLVGFGFVSAVLFWLREYLLFIVKAGHIAVLAHLVDGLPVPGGSGQIAYARAVVTARFAEANAFFLVDQLVRGVVGVITGLVSGFANIVPLPGLREIARFVNAVVRMSLNYADEVVLARNFRLADDDPFDAARDGLVLYAQNGTRMVRNAVWLVVIQWLLAALVFLLLLGPAGAFAFYLPGTISGYSALGAFVLAWAVKAAIIDPFAVCALMQVYFRAIERQRPDPEWEQRLDGASRHFRRLAEQARTAFGGRAQTGHALGAGG